MGPSSPETYSLDAVLDKVIRERGFDRKLLEQRALLLWSEVVGPKIAPHTQPMTLAGGQLRVTVSDTVWITELNFQKPQLIRRLNERVGAEVVQDILFRVGSVRPEGTSPPPSPREGVRPSVPLEAIELTPEEEAAIDQIVADVEDEELRETLRRIFINQGKANKLRAQE